MSIEILLTFIPNLFEYMVRLNKMCLYTWDFNNNMSIKTNTLSNSMYLSVNALQFDYVDDAFEWNFIGKLVKTYTFCQSDLLFWRFSIDEEERIDFDSTFNANHNSCTVVVSFAARCVFFVKSWRLDATLCFKRGTSLNSNSSKHSKGNHSFS